MTPVDRLASARAQLRAVKALRKGWDSYQGDPPTPAALAVATSLVESPGTPPERVAATRTAGVRLEWPFWCTSADISKDGAVTVDVHRLTGSVSVAVSLVDAATREEPERASAGVRKEGEK